MRPETLTYKYISSDTIVTKNSNNSVEETLKLAPPNKQRVNKECHTCYIS
jgi:hypothetical protein